MNAFQSEIQKALDIAWSTHRCEWRKSSPAMPYMVHIFDVMRRLESWGIMTDQTEVHQAAILHDVIESGAELRDLFDAGIPNHVRCHVRDLTFFPGDVDGDTEHQLKTAYLASFAEKPIVPLVVKVADRLCNVDDFTRSGDKLYARKYWKKADQLFATMADRHQEIVDRFGLDVCGRILEDSELVANRAFFGLA